MITQVHKDNGSKTFFARISDFRKHITESLFLEGEIRYHNVTYKTLRRY